MDAAVSSVIRRASFGCLRLPSQQIVCLPILNIIFWPTFTEEESRVEGSVRNRWVTGVGVMAKLDEELHGAVDEESKVDLGTWASHFGSGWWILFLRV